MTRQLARLVGLAALQLAAVHVQASQLQGACTDTILNHTGLVDGAPGSKTFIGQVTATDTGDCCAKCSAKAGCKAWTFSSLKHTCRMSTEPSPHNVGGVVSGSSVPVPPPSPGPPAPGPPGPPPPVPFPKYCSSGGKKCLNVLYFVADDMRSDWGTYGLPVHTPNLDALSNKSMLFEHAYCQLSVCAPSRMSFMTSRRPDTFKVWNFIDTVPAATTQATPGHFRDHGYITLGLGKTFHQGRGAWNAEKYWNLEDKPYYPYQAGKCPHGGQGGGHCMQTDDQIYDYHLRLNTIDYLNYAANKSSATGRPFYVMAGFRKPHAPWQYPKRMWDLYESDNIAIPTHKVLPTGAPLIAWSRQLGVSLENGTGFSYDPTHPVPDWVMQDQRHAYYASVSYVDEHVGFIMKTLEDSGAAPKTIVLFHADHGYHLGEHGEWEKKSNFDLVVRVPLMIHVPGMEESWGKRSAALVELVDVFPTVAALAGLPLPAGVDGTDRSALLQPKPPAAHLPASDGSAAYHQYPACGCANTPPKQCYNKTRAACNNTPRNKFDFMGYSMRTADFRYTAWVPWKQDVLLPDWTAPFAEELYGHDGDHSFEMDNFENLNLATSKPDVAKQMHQQLQAFFSLHQRNAVRGPAQPIESDVADTSDEFDN